MAFRWLRNFTLALICTLSIFSWRAEANTFRVDLPKSWTKIETDTDTNTLQIYGAKNNGREFEQLIVTYTDFRGPVGANSDLTDQARELDHRRLKEYLKLFKISEISIKDEERKTARTKGFKLEESRRIRYTRDNGVEIQIVEKKYFVDRMVFGILIFENDADDVSETKFTKYVLSKVRPLAPTRQPFADDIVSGNSNTPGKESRGNDQCPKKISTKEDKPSEEKCKDIPPSLRTDSSAKTDSWKMAATGAKQCLANVFKNLKITQMIKFVKDLITDPGASLRQVYAAVKELIANPDKLAEVLTKSILETFMPKGGVANAAESIAVKFACSNAAGKATLVCEMVGTAIASSFPMGKILKGGLELAAGAANAARAAERVQNFADKLEKFKKRTDKTNSFAERVKKNSEEASKNVDKDVKQCESQSKEKPIET